MCGLKSKLLNPDFNLLIKQYDILVFTETKTDNYDVLELPNDYTFYVKHRKNCKKKSGGIIIIYKKNLETFLNFLSSESEYVQWLEISKKISILNENLLIGCVYVPPEYTKYSNEDSFTEIEEELIQFKKNTKFIALFGDFNSRTAKLLDFVEPDENLLEILNIENENEDEYNILQKLEENDVPLERYNQDCTYVNRYGSKLIELCRRSNIFIENGRLFHDKFVGHTTCKGVSTVDYLLLSPIVFDIISEFEVIDFNPMFSDVHNRIHFTFLFPNVQKSSINQDTHKLNQHVRWRPAKANEFAEVIEQSPLLSEIENVLEQINDDTLLTPELVNTIVNDISTLLTSTASSVFHNRKRRINFGNDHKPWFDKDCHDKREAFHKVKTNYKFNKSAETKNLMNEKAKVYRKQIYKSYSIYQEKCASELRSLSKADPKAFWATLNKYSNTKKVNADIPVDIFFEYFRNLNSAEEDAIDVDIESFFFANENDLISQNQAGFRKGHSTLDNIFVLHSLITLYNSFGKNCTLHL